MKGGQVPVGRGFAPPSDSGANGGQVPVRQTTEGQRPGSDWTSRGAVSPLGNATGGNGNNLSPREEKSERPA